MPAGTGRCCSKSLAPGRQLHSAMQTVFFSFPELAHAAFQRPRRDCQQQRSASNSSSLERSSSRASRSSSGRPHHSRRGTERRFPPPADPWAVFLKSFLSEDSPIALEKPNATVAPPPAATSIAVAPPNTQLLNSLSSIPAPPNTLPYGIGRWGKLSILNDDHLAPLFQPPDTISAAAILGGIGVGSRGANLRNVALPSRLRGGGGILGIFLGSQLAADGREAPVGGVHLNRRMVTNSYNFSNYFIAPPTNWRVPKRRRYNFPINAAVGHRQLRANTSNSVDGTGSLSPDLPPPSPIAPSFDHLRTLLSSYNDLIKASMDGTPDDVFPLQRIYDQIRRLLALPPPKSQDTTASDDNPPQTFDRSLLKQLMDSENRMLIISARRLAIHPLTKETSEPPAASLRRVESLIDSLYPSDRAPHRQRHRPMPNGFRGCGLGLLHEILIAHRNVPDGFARALRYVRKFRRTGVSLSPQTVNLLFDVCAKERGVISAGQWLEDEVEGVWRLADSTEPTGFKTRWWFCDEDRASAQRLWRVRLRKTTAGIRVRWKRPTVVMRRLRSAESLSSESLLSIGKRGGRRRRRSRSVAFKFVRNARTFNFLMNAMIAAGDLSGAVECLRKMRAVRVRPNAFTYVILMQAYVRRQDMTSVTRCFDMIRSEGMRVPRIAFEILIHGHLTHTLPFSATNDMTTEDFIAARQKRHTDISPSSPAVVHSQGSAALDDTERASLDTVRGLIEQMLAEGYKPGCVMYSMLMSARLRRGEPVFVEPLFQDMLRAGVEPDLVCCTSRVQAFLELGELERAKRFVVDMEEHDGLKCDIVLMTVLIDGLGKGGDLDGVAEVCKVMGERGISPNIVTMNCLIYAHCVNRDMNGAMGVLAEMEARGFVPGVVTYNSLMQGYSLVGDVDAVVRIFDAMRQNGVLAPRAASYNIVMSAHVRVGNIDGAMRWYRAMLDDNVEPSLVTYNIVINANAAALNLMGAWETVSRLLSAGFRPDALTYSPIIRVHSRRGDVSGARRLVMEVNERLDAGELHIWGSSVRGACAADDIIFQNQLMDASRRAGDVPGVISVFNSLVETTQQQQQQREQMGWSSSLSRGPTIHTFDIVIRAFGSIGDMVSAQKWFDAARSYGIVPDTRLFNGLLSGYAAIGDHESARRVYTELQMQGGRGGSGVGPDAFSETLLLKAYMRSRANAAEKAADRGATTSARKGVENVVVGDGGDGGEGVESETMDSVLARVEEEL